MLYLMERCHMNCHTIRNLISEIYGNGEVWYGYIPQVEVNWTGEQRKGGGLALRMKVMAIEYTGWINIQ